MTGGGGGCPVNPFLGQKRYNWANRLCPIYGNLTSPLQIWTKLQYIMYLHNSACIREGFKKKIVEYSTKGLTPPPPRLCISKPKKNWHSSKKWYRRFVDFVHHRPVVAQLIIFDYILILMLIKSLRFNIKRQTLA